MRTLVIPDIHERIPRVREILVQAAPYDAVVALGDWFDSFRSSPYSVTETVEFLADETQDWVFLYGNHDLPYAFPKVRSLYCSGHDSLKLIAIKEAGVPIFQNFKLVHRVGPWTLTHAGVNRQIYRQGNLEAQAEYALAQLAQGQMTSFVGAGRARGGMFTYGGVTWLDWNQEFVPIAGLNQIIGHTRHPAPARLGSNLDLDTDLSNWAIIEGDTVTVYDDTGLLFCLTAGSGPG